MLLDWDCNVGIADFGHNISPDNPQPPSFPSFLRDNPTGNCPSVDSLYLAPECYENLSFQESDLFSFGLILYQILTGQTYFPKSLQRHQLAHRLIMNKKWPVISQFILPASRELIIDCRSITLWNG
jgi:hypothetical protein